MVRKKYLVVCGDSFTEGHLLGEKGSWAYYLAKKMNLELINLAVGGMGNEWISNTLLTYLESKQISIDEVLVGVGWSDISRQMAYFNNVLEPNLNNLFHIVPGDLLDDYDVQPNISNEWVYENRKALYPFYSSLNWCLFKTYQSLFYTKLYLKSNNIPHIFFDVITDNKIYYKNNIPYFKDSWKSFWTENLQKLELNTEPSVIQNMLSEKNVNFIFDENYISIGGKPVVLWLQNEGNQIYEIGNEGHLNELGSDILANEIFEKLKKILYI